MATKEEKKKYPDWWYQPQHQEEMNALAGQITSRPAFKFKVNQEALYDYYKGEHDRQGRLDRLDTEAKGAGLTGGFDNSYATQAGQQAYENQIGKLRLEVAPELRQAALKKYTQEGNALVGQYEQLQKQEENAYKQWQKDHKDEIKEWEGMDAAEQFIAMHPELDSYRNHTGSYYQFAVEKALREENLTRAEFEKLMKYYGISFGNADVSHAMSGKDADEMVSYDMFQQELEAATKKESAEGESVDPNRLGAWQTVNRFLPRAPKAQEQRENEVEAVQNAITHKVEKDNPTFVTHDATPHYLVSRPSAKDLDEKENYGDLMLLQDYEDGSKYRHKDVGAHATQKEYTSMDWDQADALWDAFREDSSPDDILYEAVNGNYLALIAAGKSGSDALNGLNEKYTNTPSELLHLSEDERSVFNYVYNAYGVGAAKTFLNKLTGDLTIRQRVAVQEAAAQRAAAQPVLSTIDTIVTSPFRGQIANMGTVSDLLRHGEIQENADYNYLNYQTDAIRGAVSSKIENESFLGKFGSFLYNVGTSMGDSAMNTVFSFGNPQLSAIISGSNAAASTISNAKDRGLNDAQALLLGGIAGVAEGFFEEKNLEYLLGPNLKKDGVVKFILKNATNEASEEVFTELTNTAADLLIAWDKNQMKAAIEVYKAQGMSTKEAGSKAFCDKLLEIGLAGLSGALSGGLMSGGRVTFNAIANATHKSHANPNSDRQGMQAQVPPAVDMDEDIEEVKPTQPVTEQTEEEWEDLPTFERSPESEADRAMWEDLEKEDAPGEKVLGPWVAQALENYRQQGELTVGAMLMVLNDGKSLQKLTELTGIEIPDGDTAESRAAVQEAVALLAEQPMENFQDKNLYQRSSGDFLDSWGDLVSKNTGADKIAQSQIPKANQAAQVATPKATTPNSRGTESPATVAKTEISPLKAASKKYGAQAAMMENAYQEGQDVQRFDREYKLAYDMGKEGAPRELMDGGAFAYLTAEQKNTAYQSGAAAAENAGIVAEAVKSLGITGEHAGVLTQSFNANQITAKDYAMGLQEAYEAGKTGIPLAEAGSHAAKLTDAQRQIAYKQGQKAHGNQVAREQAQMQRKRGTVKGYGVDVKAMAQAFNVNQAYAYKAIAQIADVTGVDVVLFESKPDANGELRGGVIDGIDMSNAQGAFSWHNGKIYIDINAGVLKGADMGDVAKYSMLRTFTHEFTHFIEKHNAEQYDAFRELVFDTMRRNGTDPDALIQAYMDRHEGTTRDAASREVVAEAMTDILPQSRFVEELAQKHEGIFKTLRNKLKNFVKRIKAYFKNIGSSQSAEVAAVTQYMDGALRYAQEIVDAFDRVAVQAVENYQAEQTTQKNTAPEGGVQMQEKASVQGVDISDGKAYDGVEVNGLRDLVYQQHKPGRDILEFDHRLWEEKKTEAIQKYGLTQDEADAVDSYVGGRAYYWNAIMRGDSDYERTEFDEFWIRQTINGLHKFPCFKGRTYRNLSFATQEKLNLFREDHRAGEEVDINYFSSSSKDPNGYSVPGNHVVHMVIDGFSGRDISESYSIPGQKEVVHLPGTKLHIVSVTAANDGNPLIYAQEVNKHGKDVETNSGRNEQSFAGANEERQTGNAERKRNDVGGVHQYRRMERDGDEIDGAQVQQPGRLLQTGEVKNHSKFEEQNQERKGTITNRDIIAQIEGKTELEREKLQEYQDILNKAQEQSQIAAQKQRELDELLKTEGSKDGKKVLALKEDIMKAKNRRSTYEGMLHRMETGILSVLIEREKGPILEKLRNTYGTIPKGEKAVRDDSLPVSVDGKTKVSRTARTVKGAGVTPDEFADLIDTEVVKGGLSYVPITNDKTTQEAVEWISNEGWEMARAKWHTEVQAGKTGADLVARGALLLNNAAKAGDKNAWLDILHDYQFLGTKTAQGMQAMKILKKLAPEDKLYTIKRSIAQMVKDMKLGFEITIDPELEAAYRNAKTAKEAKKLLAEIQQSVADQIPSTWMDKWTALRYLNMLGNLRTQIRNLAGNTGMMLVTGTKDAVAVGLEKIAYAASGGQFRKTKSLVVSGEMLKAARADYDLVESIIQGGGKYSDSRNESMEFARAVREKQRIFRSKMGVPLEMYRKGTNWAMEKGDVFFSKIAYAKALAGYLKANGVKGGDFSKVDTLLMNEARLYAVQEAQEATFRDTNALSKWVSTLGRKDTTWAPFRTISEGVMPFRKTPANVLVRAEEYSPLGIVNSLYTSIRAMQKGSEVTGAQVINSWSKTLTGTGLFALGMLLQSLGVLVGGPDEDDDLDRFEDLNGQQNYALKFGDVYITIDWLSPMAMPLFMGGQTKKLMEEGGIQFKDVEKVLTSIADPMIQMSMLQGVNDTLENVRYAENNMGQLLINAAVSYLTQGLTNTMLGQMERGFEEQRMSTYVDKNSAMPDWMQKALGKASAKIPGWDYNQIPYINAWGQEEQNPAPWQNLPYNMLSPSYISQGQEDAVSQELARLNEVQSDVNVFPSTPEKKYGDRYLSSDEYVALAKAQGQTQRQIVEGMVGSELYEGLPDAYKAKAIELAYGYARESAQIEVLGRDGFTSDWMAELGEDTAQGILKHVIGENIKSMYLGGDITAEEAVKRRMEYHGDTEDEAKEKVTYWDFQTDNPQYADWSQDTVTKYKDLEPDTAAHVIEVLGGLSAEDGYTSVRPVQKLEAIASDSDLSAKDKETALRANMDSKLEAKYDTARDMGISMGNFVKAYRKYQDTSGEGKKATVIAYYKKTFGISNSKAEDLYDLFVGKK